MLAEVARHIEARCGMMPRHLLVPISPLFRDLERDAEAVSYGAARNRIAEHDAAGMMERGWLPTAGQSPIGKDNPQGVPLAGP